MNNCYPIDVSTQPSFIFRLLATFQTDLITMLCYCTGSLTLSWLRRVPIHKLSNKKMLSANLSGNFHSTVNPGSQNNSLEMTGQESGLSSICKLQVNTPIAGPLWRHPDFLIYPKSSWKKTVRFTSSWRWTCSFHNKTIISLFFNDQTVYYYNFGWKDYEHGSLEGLLNAVKVLSFAVTQGKVAVHCHAGCR